MARTVEEYDVHRSTIAVWIQVEYTLYGLAATTVAAALGFFKAEKPFHWPIYSAGLLTVVSCLGFFIAFARARLMLMSAYLVREFPRFADWEISLPGIFKHLHPAATILLFSVLGLGSLLYPASTVENWASGLTLFTWPPLGLSVAVYVGMMWISWQSYNRDYFATALPNTSPNPESPGVPSREQRNQPM
jgi:hypothetical protein